MKLNSAEQLEAVALIYRAVAKMAQTGDYDLAEIAARMSAWLARDAATLDAALGVDRSPCQRDPRNVFALARRDEAVRVAVREWGGVDAFIRAVDRYRAGGWLRDRLDRNCPPRLANRRERLLWQILRERDRSLSRSAVYVIIQNAP